MDTSPHRLTVARLNGAATRLAGWRPPHGPDRTAALNELRQLGGTDPAPYAEAAGTMLGAHPAGSASWRLNRNAATLLLEAVGLDQDDERVRQWIAVGRDRRERGKAALQAGDNWDGQA